MQIKSSLISAALIAASVSAQQPGSQQAYYAPGAGKCLGDDMVWFMRVPMIPTACYQSYNNFVNVTKGVPCATAGDTIPVGVSCLPNIYDLPRNPKGNPFMVQELFTSASCSGQPTAVTGVQSTVVRSVNGTNTMFKCVPGGEIQIMPCESTSDSSCTLSETVNSGKCVDFEDGTSLRMRCIASGGSLTGTSSSASGRAEMAASLLVAPLMFLISSLF